MEKLMTTTEAAKKFNVTVVTIKNWVKTYNLPHERTAGGHIRFTDTQVMIIENYIKERWGLR